MQAYSRTFARIYNARWGFFARQVAPRLEAFYAGTAVGLASKAVLDLCCGTGQLAVHFLERGYRVTGIDLSEVMLDYARENTVPYVESGQAKFLQADAAAFRLEDRFGLAVSTFDALNHLEDVAALGSCFHCVYDVLVDGGWFIFDLNTRLGLERHWGGISVEDTHELMLVNRSIYDCASSRAYTRISGFALVKDGQYERFEETVYNTAFDMENVRQLLLSTGFRSAHCARVEELTTPLVEPECEPRVFFVAQKQEV